MPSAPIAAPNINWLRASPRAVIKATADRVESACLVIGPQWVGDGVMAEPLIASLASTRPVDIVCLPSLVDLYRAMPGVRQVRSPPFARGRLQWSERRQFAQTLRAEGYGLAVVCPNSWKSALIPWMAGIPGRRGLLGEARWLLLNDIRRPAGASQPQAYASLASTPAEVLARRPSLRATMLPAHHPLAWPRLAGRRLALAPGADFGPAKQWPADHWASLASRWLSSGGQAMILGGPRDVAIAAEIVALLPDTLRPRLANRAGQTRLSEALGLLAESEALVSNDSGLMHVGAALGLPTLGLYGSSDPRRTPVQGPQAEMIWRHLDCSPCFQRSCPLGTLACLESIRPEEVEQRLARLGQNAGS